jgi:hypothetical protein
MDTTHWGRQAFRTVVIVSERSEPVVILSERSESKDLHLSAQEASD